MALLQGEFSRSWGCPGEGRVREWRMPSGRTTLEGVVRGVVGVLEHEGRYLMIRRAVGILAGGTWCFPGGGIEPGETAEQAVVREFDEEIGIVVSAGRQLWEWHRPDGALTLVWWRVYGGDGLLRLNPNEVDAARWMTEREICAHPEVLPNNVVFFHHLHGGGAERRAGEARRL